LPLSFGLVDATSAVHSHVQVAIPLKGTTTKDLKHTLAYKMLQISVNSSMEMLVLDFAPSVSFSWQDVGGQSTYAISRSGSSYHQAFHEKKIG